jgi:septal ring factor EnvC (AmiA/AmiB activator)
VALATAVLARDLEETRLLRAELDRVRGERTALSIQPGEAAADTTPAAPGGPTPAFLRPVSGTLLTPFGVGRDHATGAWIFRAAATFGVSSREIVHSPASGRVVRVADSIAGGVAVVLSVPGVSAGTTWTVVLSGLDSVAVAPGEDVAGGAPLGTAPAGPGATVRVETWRGRSPVDPTAVLRVRDKR